MELWTCGSKMSENLSINCWPPKKIIENYQNKNMIKTIQMLIIIVIIVIKSKQLNKFFDPSTPPMRKVRDEGEIRGGE